MKSWKLHDCLVCETGELRQFYYLADANRFAIEKSRQGYHVLRGISYV